MLKLLLAMLVLLFAVFVLLFADRPSFSIQWLQRLLLLFPLRLSMCGL
jgi:hypothetical protein